MATSPEAVRVELAAIATTATADLVAEVSAAPIERQVSVALDSLGLLVPPWYDAAGSLAVDWYDELRDESSPTSLYTPTIIGDPATGWIEREAAKFQRELDAMTLDLEAETRKMLAEIERLYAKEVERGYRDSILGNTRQDEDAIGWSRIARAGACKMCEMLADKGAVYRSESTAIFAAHPSCNCAARPEFKGGEHGPEASVVQYEASAKRARTQEEQDARNARLRKYLNENYPDARG